MAEVVKLFLIKDKISPKHPIRLYVWYLIWISFTTGQTGCTGLTKKQEHPPPPKKKQQKKN